MVSAASRASSTLYYHTWRLYTLGQYMPPIFSGRPLRSATIRLTIGSLEKTLTSTEIEECASGVIKKLTKRLGAELRTR